ncbi:MAG: OsmC family protein [Calditrichia bacterium]
MSQIVVKNVDGITFVGRGNTKHWVPMDGPETFGGSDAGTRPMELFLISLAGCTGADVASLMKKMRVPYQKFEVYVDAERAEEHPKVYTKIDLKYKFWGKNLEENKDKIEKSINLSQDKYCSVSAMIRAADIPLNYTYELAESE